jgi:hypothetical protein
MPPPNDPGDGGSSGDPTSNQHHDKPYHYGDPDQFPNLLVWYQHRFFAIRGGNSTLLTNVEEATWDDGAPSREAIMSGTITLRDPSYGLGPRIKVDEGDLIRCEYTGGAGWKEMWTMRVHDPGYAAKDGQRTYNLTNDLDLLSRSTDRFLFRVGPGTPHPAGLTMDQIIGIICDKYHVDVDCVKGKYVRKRTWAWGYISPLEAIRRAITGERAHTGRQFTVQFRAGKLLITERKRNPHLRLLGRTLIDAAFKSHLARGETVDGLNTSEGYYASHLTVRGLATNFVGTDLMGHAKQANTKIIAGAHSNEAWHKYGFVHRIVWSSDAKTYADLKREGAEYLRWTAKPIRELTLTHPGIPSVRRGDAIQLGLGDAQLFKQIVWVREAQFSVTPGDYVMTLTVTFEDPFLKGPQELNLLTDDPTTAESIAAGQKPKPKKHKVRSDGIPTG